jgi:hypothetical protein
VQPNFADEDFGMFEAGKEKSPYRYVVEVSADGESWKQVFDRSESTDARPHELLVLDRPVKARYVRLTSTSALTGKLSLHDLRVFGLARGAKPAAATGLKVVREADRRRMELSWQPASGATAYIVRWGLRPDALFSACQTSETKLEKGLFSTDQSYCFRVDAIGDTGITPGKEIIRVE